MTNPERPTCNFRLSIAQLRLLEPGLRMIVQGLANSVPRHPHHLLPPPKSSTGRYAKCHEALVRKIWKIVEQALNHPSSGKVRLRLDCFGLAACLLAGRISRRLNKKNEAGRSIPALLSRLDSLRKRAVRSYISRHGKQSYAQASRRWQQFVRWVRTNVLRKIPQRLLDPGIQTGRRRFMPKHDHRNVQLAMQAAERELTSRGEPVPSEPELRSLVRRAFRMSRRSLTAPSIRAMTSRPEGAHFLAWFISKQTRTVRSQCSQEVELSAVEPKEVEPPEVERQAMEQQEAGTMTSVGSHKPCAQATITGHPRFQQLDKSAYRSLEPVDRAEYVSEIWRTGKWSVRKLAGLLKADPGTIRRDLAVDKLTAEQKDDIRNGKSVTRALEAANRETSKPRENATAEEKIAALQAEIIRFLDHRNLAPSQVVNVLDHVIGDKLPRLRKNGKPNGRKRSLMKLWYLVRYTRPKNEPDPFDLAQWFPSIAGWLLRWSTAREQEYDILDSAMRRAREHFGQQPPGLLPYGTPYEVYEALARLERAETEANSLPGAESMRSPQSKVNPHAAKEEQLRKREAADAADVRYIAHMRELMSGNSSGNRIPAHEQPRIQLTTVGEESESQRKKAAARAEQRAEKIRQELGWPDPGRKPPQGRL